MNPESQAAHARIEPTKQQTYAEIMDFALAQGIRGLTADELSAAWRCSPNHVAPRITELKKSGRLVRTGRTRPTRSGSAARVLVARQFTKANAPAAQPTPERLALAHKWIAAARGEPEEPDSLFRDLKGAHRDNG